MNILHHTIMERKGCPSAEQKGLAYKCRLTEDVCITPLDFEHCITYEKSWKEEIRK